jgi:hypothetical protein
MPKTASNPTLTPAGELPEIVTLRNQLRALAAARKAVAESAAQHEATAEKMEKLITSSDLTKPAVAAEVATLDGQVRALAIQHFKCNGQVELAEAGLAIAVAEATKSAARRIRDGREAIIDRTAEVFGRYFASKTKAKEVASESDAANELFRLGWMVDGVKHYAAESGAKALLTHLDALSESEARSLATSH